MPLWIQATLWGGFAGSAVLAGSAIGCFSNLKQRTVAGIMAFGSGALISALSFELMAKAYDKGGFASTSVGFVAGAIIYTAANYAVSRRGAKHRKRSNLKNKSHLNLACCSGTSLAIGALIDGIPESIVIGLGMIEGSTVSLVTVAAVFISNLPEGLSSSVGMKRAGKKLSHILMIWGGIALAGAVSSCMGYLFFRDMSTSSIAFIMALAAGGVLAMITDTMVPEAFEETHDFAGLITVVGFLSAFVLEKMGM